tara:strand:+ start:12101 stop:12793 length:693 start_codon:yes stop_codon:yes gene_type:complete
MMLSQKDKHTWLMVFLVAFCTFIISYIVFFYKADLPIYNPADLNPELVDYSVQEVGANHVVSDFKLINQNGKTITQIDYLNKIYVVDFFFTRCPSICPIMANNMKKLQERFLSTEQVMLLSLSVTPEMDSVPILKEYSDKYNANAIKWNIATGDKKHIYNLARKSYFTVNDIGDGLLQDFIHTPNFVLVDSKKQIRGIYDGTKDDEIDRLINDISLLVKNSNKENTEVFN